MKVRANGLSLPDLDTLAALETGRYWTPAKRPGEALYRPAVNNGYWAEDILTNGLVLYVPLWLYSGAKFPSVDAYHHTCTVTGATWGIQGRTFNGTSDLINCGRITQIEGAAALWTIQGWFKMTDELTSYRCLLSYDDNEILGASDLYMYWDPSPGATVHYHIGGSPGEEISTITNLNDYGWHFLEISKTATNVIIREDGVEKDDNVEAGGAFSSSHTFRIGDNSNINHWKGQVGDFIIIAGRTGTLTEHIHTYQATKWRYQ